MTSMMSEKGLNLWKMPLDVDGGSDSTLKEFIVMTEDVYASRRFDGQTEQAIDVAVLETVPFGYPGRATEVVYETTSCFV